MPITINGSGTITGASTLATTPSVTQINSSAVSTPTLFGDSAGTQVGTLCRAWVNFNGVTTASIRGSFNVSSITRNISGDYTINFTNALSDANYSISGSQGAPGTGLAAGIFSANRNGNDGSVVAPTTTACRINTCIQSGAAQDNSYAYVAIFR